MTLRHEWRQAGTTRRAHLVVKWQSPPRYAGMSACGMVRLAAWVPVGEAVQCGLCRRLAAQAERRGAPMVTP